MTNKIDFFLHFFKNQKNSDNKEFLNHSKNYIIAEFFTKALTFLALPIITRVLSPSDFGVVSVFIAVIAVFEIVFELNFRSTINRYFFEKEFDFKSFVGTNLLFLTIFGLVLMGVLFFWIDFWVSFFNVSSQVIKIGFIVSYIYIYFNIYLSYLRAAQKSKEFSILNSIANSLILVISVVLFITLKEDKYLGRVYATLFVTSAFLFFVLFRLFKLAEWKIQTRYIGLALVFGVPLLPHTLSNFILAQFDKIIINQLNGEYDAGLYSFAYNVAMIMYVFIMGMDKAWSPMFYKKMNSGNKAEINLLARKYSKYVFTVAIFLILFSREIVFIMADEDYYSSLSIIPIIISSYIFVFLYTFYIKYSLFHKKTYLVSICTLLAGAFNVVLNYLYIPSMGYEFAAYSTLMSYFMLFVLHYLNVTFMLKEKNIIKIRYFIWPIIWLVLAILLVNVVLEMLQLSLLVAILIRVLFFAIAIYIFWKEVVDRFLIKGKQINE